MRDWLLVLCHHRRHNLAKLIWESQQWTIRNFTRNGWVWTIKPLRSNPKLKNWRLTSGFNMVQPSLSVTNHQKLGASHVTSLYGTPQWAFPMACSLRSPISQGARSPGRRCPFPSLWRSRGAPPPHTGSHGWDWAPHRSCARCQTLGPLGHGCSELLGFQQIVGKIMVCLKQWLAMIYKWWMCKSICGNNII